MAYIRRCGQLVSDFYLNQTDIYAVFIVYLDKPTLKDIQQWSLTP